MKQRHYLSRIYLAGPFFNEKQLNNMKTLEDLCKLHNINGISPRKFMVLKPRAPLSDREKVFKENVRAIDTSNLVLACVDDKDTGTAWEMGYAYAMRKPVVAYTWGESVNVMLAQSCAGFLTGFEQIKKFLEGRRLGYAEHDLTGQLWDFNWEVARQWKKSIY